MVVARTTEEELCLPEGYQRHQIGPGIDNFLREKLFWSK